MRPLHGAVWTTQREPGGVVGFRVFLVADVWRHKMQMAFTRSSVQIELWEEDLVVRKRVV